MVVRVLLAAMVAILGFGYVSGVNAQIAPYMLSSIFFDTVKGEMLDLRSVQYDTSWNPLIPRNLRGHLKKVTIYELDPGNKTSSRVSMRMLFEPVNEGDYARMQYFDSNGKLKRTERVLFRKQRIAKSTKIGNRTDSIEPTFEDSFDQRGFHVRRFDKIDKIEIRAQYDDSGRCVAMMLGRADSYAYNYNSTGRCIESTVYQNGKPDGRISFKYDAYGNVTSEEWSDEINGLKYVNLRVKCRYAYDSKGNIIQQVTSVSHGTGKAEVLGKWKGKYEYY